ncbi:MAG: hypothetical protein ACR2KJ_12660 [Jatrophihabitans sp.]
MALGRFRGRSAEISAPTGPVAPGTPVTVVITVGRSHRGSTDARVQLVLDRPGPDGWQREVIAQIPLGEPDGSIAAGAYPVQFTVPAHSPHSTVDKAVWRVVAEAGLAGGRHLAAAAELRVG